VRTTTPRIWRCWASGVAAAAWRWRWSSAAAHVAGRDDDLVQVEPLRERVKDWRPFLAEGLPTEEVELLRRHARTGRPLGETAFLDRIERMLHRIVPPPNPDRNPGRNKYCVPGPPAKSSHSRPNNF
jgi:hypothetical protein